MSRRFKKIITFTQILSIPAVMTLISASCSSGHIKGDLQSIILKNKPSSKPRAGIFVCDKCGKLFEDTIMADDINMPIINLEHDLSEVGKEKITMPIQLWFPNDQPSALDCNVEIKLQGDSSLSFPKKNYNIQLKDPKTGKNIKLKFGNWPELSKFTLKANYIDCSHLRNITLAKMYGDMIHQSHIHDEIDELLNGGAIDGFPIALYNKNKFHGLYTMNIPKEKQLYGMDGSGKKECMLFAGDWSQSALMNEPIKMLDIDGWDIEYCSDEDKTLWIRDSYNQLVAFVNNNDGEAFKTGISQYLNVRRAIDYIIFIQLGCLGDNAGKNIMWVTYDGQHWIPGPYDLDCSYGFYWNGGVQHYPPNYDLCYGPRLDNEPLLCEQALFKKMLTNFQDEIKNEYKFLRQESITIENFKSKIQNFNNQIHQTLPVADKASWPDMPGKDVDHIELMLSFMEARINWLDEYWK